MYVRVRALPGASAAVIEAESMPPLREMPTEHRSQVQLDALFKQLPEAGQIVQADWPLASVSLPSNRRALRSGEAGIKSSVPRELLTS